MTAAVLTRLPLEAGGAVLASTGRMALSTVQWSVAHYMRAPLANTGIAAMLGFALLASSNALFLQTHRHPAPLFAPVTIDGQVVPEIKPVVPAVRPVKQAVVVPKVVAAPVAEVDPSKPIGNTEVFELQRKLEALKFFDGTVDGYYGPRTAHAIRAFEEGNGLKPVGELTPQILKTILNAPISSVAPAAKPLPAPEPVPEVKPLAQVIVAQPVAEPVAVVATLKAPEPLDVGVTAKVTAMQPVADSQPLTRQLPETPQAAVDIAVDTAGDAIDAIINGVQTIAQTTTGKPAPTPLEFGPGVMAKKDAPVLVATAEAEPVVMATAEVSGDAAIKPLPVAVLDTDATIEDLMPAFSVTDPAIVSKVQRRLSALGFLHGPIDGKPGEATAKAIRTFETFYNYERTGRITPELPDLLVKAGAPL